MIVNSSHPGRATRSLFRGNTFLSIFATFCNQRSHIASPFLLSHLRSTRSIAITAYVVSFL